MTSNLDQTLLERSCRYGAFIDVANRTNNIQAAILHNAPQLSSTTPLYREASTMLIAGMILPVMQCWFTTRSPKS